MSNHFYAQVIADSVTETGARLTTLELTFPRLVLAEFNTHRVFSRNSASSRAIPVSKQIAKVIDFPYVPSTFGANQPGMQASVDLEGQKAEDAKAAWLVAKNDAVLGALRLLFGEQRLADLLGTDYRSNSHLVDDTQNAQKINAALKAYETEMKETRASGEEHDYLNVHKQIANRLLEPFTWHTVLVTATEWDNFWALRDHDDADPAIRGIASLAHQKYLDSAPVLLTQGEWHLPLIQEDEKPLVSEDIELWKKVSSGRCARVSYETHHGVRDINADVSLFERLYSGGHMSPLEHIATPLSPEWKHEDMPVERWSGNFRGWKQWRKDFRHEDNYGAVLAEKS